MVDPDPASRLTVSQVLQHQWMNAEPGVLPTDGSSDEHQPLVKQLTDLLCVPPFLHCVFVTICTGTRGEGILVICSEVLMVG